MARLLVSLGAAVLLSLSVFGKTPDDNVVVSKALDEYVFIAGKDGAEVRHSRKREYTATRHSASVKPHIFYNDRIRLDKASGGKMQYRDVNSPAVFHDDSKVCFFSLYLKAKDKKGTAEFRRTFLDAAHFTGVFVEDEYPVEEGTITFRIPPSMPDIYLVEENFPEQGIERSNGMDGDGWRVITYTISNLGKMPDDDSAPSALSSRPYISVRGYFTDIEAFYRYHAPLLAVDTALTEMPVDIGSADRPEIIERIYSFVQKKIRYVAYEEGEAAFRPDTPAETMRKRYGDCKSMSLLLSTLLNRAGIEAHIAIVGTNSIPWRIADNPSLASADHMICVVPDSDGYLFLDPTHVQISSRHIPSWLSGKDALVVVDGGFRMIDIPDVSPEESADVAEYCYVLSDGMLAGRAKRTVTEDFAERFTSSLDAVPVQHRSAFLAKNLVPATRADIPIDSVLLAAEIPGKICIEAPIVNTSAVIALDDVVYLDLNTTGDPFSSRIDISDRREDYKLPVSGRVVRRISVEIPEQHTVVLPENFETSGPSVNLSCMFSQDGNTVTMTKTMELAGGIIALGDIPEWNKALAEWTDACNRQIEIK